MTVPSSLRRVTVDFDHTTTKPQPQPWYLRADFIEFKVACCQIFSILIATSCVLLTAMFVSPLASALTGFVFFIFTFLIQKKKTIIGN